MALRDPRGHWIGVISPSTRVVDPHRSVCCADLWWTSQIHQVIYTSSESEYTLCSYLKTFFRTLLSIVPSNPFELTPSGGHRLQWSNTIFTITWFSLSMMHTLISRYAFGHTPLVTVTVSGPTSMICVSSVTHLIALFPSIFFTASLRASRANPLHY